MQHARTLIILDIDGLRQDVFHQALTQNAVPNLQRLFRPDGQDAAYHVDPVSVAPSITFCAQASIFTGKHPRDHRIPGNEFFDRMGNNRQQIPRHVAFDIGETYAFDDAVNVFRRDLADRMLSAEAPTLYESAAERGLQSLVTYNMYGRGAQQVVRPSVIDLARFLKGFGPLKLASYDYDRHMVNSLIKALDRSQTPPDIITAYLMGLDHHSHVHGPGSQMDYLVKHIDPQVGHLLDALQRRGLLDEALFAVVSDHGQYQTPGDDPHSIRLGFPFDMELSPLFHALGLDLHDRPGEDPHVDAVVGTNGGIAHVYLRHREDEWPVMPRFEEDVMPVARAFWDMNQTGRYRDELQDTLEAILVRNAQAEGWNAPYAVYQGEDRFLSIEEWAQENAHLPIPDVANRIQNAANSMSGDLILFAQAERGVYFGKEGYQGMHGSLHESDSACVLSFGFPKTEASNRETAFNAMAQSLSQRCQQENNRMPSIVDMTGLIRAALLPEAS